MPRVLLANGIQIECATIEETRAIVNEFADEIVPGAVAVASSRRRKRTAAEGGPGVGPAKLWAMAKWYSVKVGEITNDARSKLTRIRKTDQRAFLDLQDEYHSFIAWYAAKSGITAPNYAGASLSAMYDADHGRYATLLAEFDRQ